MTIVQEIKQCVEEQLNKNKKKFIIFPFGDIGMKVKEILKEAFGIEDIMILDNHLSRYNANIKELAILDTMNCEDYAFVLACTNKKIYASLKEEVKRYINENDIAELSSMRGFTDEGGQTIVGKYSYGPLCNHFMVEEVGAFCSIASGCDVVENHATQYISTHPFIYLDKQTDDLFLPYDDWRNHDSYFPGVSPKGVVKKLKKTIIGNDVWLGKNVIITNGANIGNGVIAGAGAVITKDVPDYAVVVGVPARIIKYRYTPEQIEGLNKIQWWNWSDEKIRQRYEDFYLPIEDFVEKYVRELEEL